MTDTEDKPVSIHSYVEIDPRLPEAEQSKQIVDFLSGGKVPEGSDKQKALQSLQTLGQEADSMEESKIIERYLTEVYGERCEEFQPGCMTCNAWASYDDYKSEKARIELTRQAQDMGMYDEPKMSIEELKKETSQEP